MSKMKSNETIWYLDILVMFKGIGGAAKLIGVTKKTAANWHYGDQLPDERYRPALQRAVEALSDDIRQFGKGPWGDIIADAIDSESWPDATTLASSVSDTKTAADFIIGYLTNHGETPSYKIAEAMAIRKHPPAAMMNATKRKELKDRLVRRVEGFGRNKVSYWSLK